MSKMGHSTLYIDESGKSSLSEKRNEPFIITGVIFDDSEINTVEGFFSYIKRKYKIKSSTPFHSYDLFENPETKLSDVSARKLLSTIADFISLIPIKIHIFSINKKLFRRSLGITTPDDLKGSKKRRSMRHFTYDIACTKLFARFAKYLEKNNNVGQIIVDARIGGNQQILNALNKSKDPTSTLDRKDVGQIKKRCTAICFAEKNYLSGGLEITDLISYTSFFHVRRQMSSMEHLKLNNVWYIIKSRLYRNDIKQLRLREIQKFFNIGADGVHKFLKR